jgi:ubiquinone/menaquinone biosynthesis C-methylase UbiE
MDPQEENGENMLKWTGERYLPFAGPEIIGAETHYEHLHRYAFASQFVPGKKVLDLASGEGYGSFMLSREAEIVVGIEIDQQAVLHAKNKYIKKNIRFIQGSILNIPIEEEKVFDVIICFEAIEHIEDQNRLLSEVIRLLKDDGLFIVSTPNKQSYTDDVNYHNPFHLKELYFKEFNELLRNYFENICFLGQRVYTGSSIWPLMDHATSCKEFNLGISNSGFYFKNLEERTPLYIVAVASNCSRNFDLMKSYLIDESNTALNFRDKQISALTVRADTLEQCVIEKDQRINELDGLLRSSNDKANKLNCIITDMQQSVVWQILMKYQFGFVEKALPHGTRRREKYDLALDEGRILVNNSWCSFKWLLNFLHIQHHINAETSEKEVSSFGERNEQPEEELLVHSHEVPLEIISIEAQIKLKKGNNLIRFHVPEGGERPCDIPDLKSEDCRCLSLAVKDISIWNGTIRLQMTFGSNWHGRENSNGGTLRWLSNDATVIISSNSDNKAKLVLQAYSFYRPRKLDIYVKHMQTSCQFRKDAGKKFELLKGGDCMVDKNVIKKELDEILESLSREI